MQQRMLLMNRNVVYITGVVRYWLGSWQLQTTFLLDELNPWRRIVLERIGGPQVFKKYSASYRTRKFINACTKLATCTHPEPDECNPCPPPQFLKKILLQSIWSRSSKWSLLLRFPTKTLYALWKTSSKITVLYISNFIFLNSKRKTDNSVASNSKHSLSSICF
jgi:hypothetical protein